MLEFFLELYSEEIPPQLQITARKELKDRMEKLLNEESLKYKSIFSYSSPTRLAILIKEMDEKVKIPSKEIKGPKVGVVDDILNSFVDYDLICIDDIDEIFGINNWEYSFFVLINKILVILSIKVLDFVTCYIFCPIVQIVNDV